VSLAPAIHPSIHGVEGKRRQVEMYCCAPGCISLSQQAHHMWARSYLRGQPTEWVSLPSGRVVSNVVGLCMRHHGFVTGGIGGHQAMIKLEPDETFIWLTPLPVEGAPEGYDWINEGLIHPQPWSATPVEVVKAKKSAAHSHPNLAEGETCESCGYTRPLKKEAGPKRKSTVYGLVVPDDAEIGSEILDEWVEQFATVLGFGDDVTKRLVRYHTIVAVMAWAMMHRQQFIEDIQEAAVS
jgi:hypothetical protein